MSQVLTLFKCTCEGYIYKEISVFKSLFPGEVINGGGDVCMEFFKTFSLGSYSNDPVPKAAKYENQRKGKFARPASAMMSHGRCHSDCLLCL